MNTAADVGFLIVVPNAAQVLVAVRFRARWCRGRILTRPLQRYRLLREGFTVRQAQVVTAALAATAVYIWKGELVADFVFCGLMLAPLVDDVVTGDDDWWKRWRRAVRNAVRWRPFAAPARRPHTTPA